MEGWGINLLWRDIVRPAILVGKYRFYPRIPCIQAWGVCQDWAVSNLGSLKDQELADFKAKYFGADVAEFKWNNQILVYNAKTNTWRSIGQIPFNAPCGEGLVYAGDSIISINGEVKPGVRSNRIYQGFIVK